jgi:hypothetical protein
LSTRSWTGYPLAGLHRLLQVGHLLDGFSVRMGTAFGAILTPSRFRPSCFCGRVRRGSQNRSPGIAAWPRHSSWPPSRARTSSVTISCSFAVRFSSCGDSTPKRTFGRPFGGGPLLGMTALLWAFSLVGPALNRSAASLFRPGLSQNCRPPGGCPARSFLGMARGAAHARRGVRVPYQGADAMSQAMRAPSVAVGLILRNL